MKNFPKNQPFVYNNKIIIKSELSKDEKKRLITELNNYWDDSMQVRKVAKLGIFSIINNPPVYDSNNFLRSIRFMDNYLKSQGYYSASYTHDTINQKKLNQYRVTPVITIELGKSITIDSFAIDLADSNLQKLAQQNIQFSLLKTGKPYTKQVISNELDRITALFKRNGYYNFTRDDIYALVDTTDSKFLNLTIDPFELAKLLDDYGKSKKENPKWDITIKQRKDTTGNSGKQYFIGQIYYYPQAGALDLTDSVINQPWLHNHQIKNYNLRFDNQIIKLYPLRTHTYLQNGQPFNQTDYFRTINALNKLGPWKQIDAKFIKRDTDSLDLHIVMVPEKKRGIENNYEISKNTGDLTAGNLVGVSFGLTYRNRNVWKQAIQSFTTLRLGVEFNPTDSSTALQTFYTTFGHTYSFPRMIGEKPIRNFIKLLPFKFIRNNLESVINVPDKRTLLSINGSYSDRFELFKLRSVTGSFGYEFKTDDKTWLYSPLNVELYSLDKLKGLDDLIKNNPFLQLSFNTGNVIGQTFTFSQSFVNKKRSNVSHLFRVSFEESGLITGLFKSLEDKVYRYSKLEIEYRESTKLPKSELAYKLYGGVGINYSSSNEIGNVLPFFKQFFVGGPNSMRAWGLRQLGQGSSLLYDTSSSSFRDRFGDIRLEANFEYRFLIYNGSFLKLSSALFTDIGNVWNVRKNDNNPNSDFAFARLGKDIAIGVGTGLRLDFGGYAVLRVDAAYKVKDPARQYNNGWVDLSNASLREKRPNGVEVRNAALQLGIGLPF
ncbi:MAG: BamA/TamA family outer membrane protein [Chitinophagaceae bacterium]